MKTREEAIDFIKAQFSLGYSDLFPIPRESRVHKTEPHYGKVELSDLIDHIYGEEDEPK